jgi:hypothetical protein
MPAGLAAILLLVLTFGVLIAFQRRPGRRHMRENWNPFKKRLPRWVRWIEGMILFVFWLVLFVMLSEQLDNIYIHFHPFVKVIAIDAGLTDLVAAGMIAWPLAALAANAVSYIIVPIRRANLTALEGLGTASLRRANIELCQMLAITVLISAPFVLYSGLRDREPNRPLLATTNTNPAASQTPA